MNVRPHVIIVGAGIGGLTASIGGKALRQAGCTVTVLEQSSRLSEIGAGIQLAPNSTRILRHLGLLSEVLKYANFPLGTVVRRYANDVEIGPRGYSGSIRRRFDAPMLVIHRADLLKVLVQATLEAGVHLHTNAQVVTIDPSFEAKVTLSNGDHVEGDILVGADGIKSRTRANIASYYGLPDKCTSTGDSAYRMVIPRGKILERCPQILKTLEIDHGLSTRWIGPNGHIMAYPIRGNAFYNVVMVHSHKAGANNEDEINLWTRKGELSELLTFYGGWSNTVQGLAACIDPEDLIQWPLNARPNLPAWTVNRVCLLGDACHPMLPYVAQGAAQAIEDAAALAVCLSRTSDVSHALTTYESVRKDRAEFIQGCAAAMRQVLHLVDGPEQEQRDATMRAPRTPGWKHPDLWADLGFQQLIWGYDIVAETEKRFIPAPKMTSMNLNTVAGQDMGIAV